jgi:peptidyl-prolyl cis-trans isomerase B (cyclophilin B)
MSKEPRGRRVPPKGRGARIAHPVSDFDAIDAAGAEGGAPSGADAGAAATTSELARARATRSQNRAAKRAASGVRPKAVRGGRPQSRSSRQSNTGLILLAIAAVAVGAAVFAFGNPFGSASSSPSPSAAAVYGDGTCPTSQPDPLVSGQSRLVTINTEKGAIVIQVDGYLSPIAAGNFVALAECKFYDGVVFHRTAALEGGKPFVIQGGDPTGTGAGGPGYTIRDEPVATTYKRGTVAMARSQSPNSQGSQFFIVLSDESGPILQSANDYAIFGNVVSGMDVADAIYAASGGVELPPDPIAMTSVTVSDVPAPTTAPSGSPATSPAASTGPTTAPTVIPTATP